MSSHCSPCPRESPQMRHPQHTQSRHLARWSATSMQSSQGVSTTALLLLGFHVLRLAPLHHPSQGHRRSVMLGALCSKSRRWPCVVLARHMSHAQRILHQSGLPLALVPLHVRVYLRRVCSAGGETSRRRAALRIGRKLSQCPNNTHLLSRVVGGSCMRSEEGAASRLYVDIPAGSHGATKPAKLLRACRKASKQENQKNVQIGDTAT